MGLLGVEQGLIDDPGFLEQLEGSVYRRLGYPLALFLHALHEGIGFEHVVGFQNRIEDVGAFRGVLQILLLEVATKDRAQRGHLEGVRRRYTLGGRVRIHHHGSWYTNETWARTPASTCLRVV